MILFGSRYTTANVISLTSTPGLQGLTTVLDRKRFTIDDLEEGWNYRSMSYERDLDLISYNVCGRESMWFLIADVNGITDPFEVVEAGRQLVVPTKQSFDAVRAELVQSA